MRRAVVVSAAGIWSKSASAASAGGSAIAMLALADLLPVVEAAAPAMLGMLGAAVVHAKFPPTSRLVAMTNGAISVVLGVVGGPTLVELSAFYFSTPSSFAVVCLASFVLAAAWPALVPTLWDSARAAVAALVARISGDTAKKGAKSGRR